jgi:hypothetical protein
MFVCAHTFCVGHTNHTRNILFIYEGHIIWKYGCLYIHVYLYVYTRPYIHTYIHTYRSEENSVHRVFSARLYLHIHTHTYIHIYRSEENLVRCVFSAWHDEAVASRSLHQVETVVFTTSHMNITLNLYLHNICIHIFIYTYIQERGEFGARCFLSLAWRGSGFQITVFRINNSVCYVHARISILTHTYLYICIQERGEFSAMRFLGLAWRGRGFQITTSSRNCSAETCSANGYKVYSCMESRKWLCMCLFVCVFVYVIKYIRA